MSKTDFALFGLIAAGALFVSGQLHAGQRTMFQSQQASAAPGVTDAAKDALRHIF